MSHTEAYSGRRDPINCPANAPDPKTQTAVDLELIAEMIGLLLRVRVVLKKWATRYAEAPHARKSVEETHRLMQEVDALYDRLPHHTKD